MNYRLYCLVAAALIATGCDGGTQKEAKPTYIIYSPNAEPLNGGPLGHPPCDAALSGWFERTDSNHDSVIDLNEFIADAKTQFARMDIDRNGYLVSEELDRYRAPYRQEEHPVKEHPHSKNQERGKRQDKPDTKSAFDQATLIDPVMSADSNLDFKVTPEEFLTQSKKNFAELDHNRNGKLSRDEVLAICRKEDK